MQSLTDLAAVDHLLAMAQANVSFSQPFATPSDSPDTGGGGVAAADEMADRLYDIDAFDENAFCHQFAPNNMSYLNISCETNLNYSVPLYGIFTPILLVTTIVANTLIVLVLSKRNMATPTNLVLMGKSRLREFTNRYIRTQIGYNE